MQIKTAVKRSYFAAEPCIVYTTRQRLPVVKNYSIYLFTCFKLIVISEAKISLLIGQANEINNCSLAAGSIK